MSGAAKDLRSRVGHLLDWLSDLLEFLEDRPRH
jgi:hypothetical protein